MARCGRDPSRRRPPPAVRPAHPPNASDRNPRSPVSPCPSAARTAPAGRSCRTGYGRPRRSGAPGFPLRPRRRARPRCGSGTPSPWPAAGPVPRTFPEANLSCPSAKTARTPRAGPARRRVRPPERPAAVRAASPRRERRAGRRPSVRPRHGAAGRRLSPAGRRRTAARLPGPRPDPRGASLWPTARPARSSSSPVDPRRRRISRAAARAGMARSRGKIPAAETRSSAQCRNRRPAAAHIPAGPPSRFPRPCVPLARARRARRGRCRPASSA